LPLFVLGLVLASAVSARARDRPVARHVGAVALFGEHPTRLSVSGALLVAAGIVAMTLPGSLGARGHAAAAAGHGLALALS
jgi:hypothetical protein